MLTKAQFDQLMHTQPNTGSQTNEPSIAQLVYRYYRANLWDTNDTEAADYTERYLSALFKQMQAESKKQDLIDDDLFESFELGHNFVIHK